MTNEKLCLLIQDSRNKTSYLEMLYQNNKGLIFEMANRYRELSDFDDLCQEGYLGLVNAAESWKEKGGAKFSTYALYWIKSYMIRYMENNNNVVRLPSNTLAQIRKMKDLTTLYYMNKARKPTIKELAKDMKLSESQVERIIEGALFLNVKSTAEPLTEQDNSYTLEDTLTDEKKTIEDIEEAIQREQLKAVIWGIVDSLDAEQARIIHERYEKDRSIKTIADRMGTTPANVKNIEAKAMREIRKTDNRKKLQSFYEQDSHIFSLSLEFSGYAYFNRTWTSAPEKVAMIAERNM